MLIRLNGPDLIMLSEMRVSKARLSGTLCRWNFFSRSYVNPVGLAGGICVAWK